ncbi:hypothetical protein BLNAU_17494 [Blattamonas nauphoetae]|uniref:Uncharacterized protein n=1 Tax=Blattamonas nauphoetae TaxID=2049346 RepID=A0ABQ9X9N4_9EUKA|nr:hypothetical protein BLNAU_17494 [Blattamonas nauphoetae]
MEWFVEAVIDETPIAGHLSSDIFTLCHFFLHIHPTLKEQNRLILPPDPEQKDIVFSRIMVALIEHFVASGDLILPNSSPTDHSHSLTVPNHSFLRWNDAESSEKLLNAVKEIKETHSLETVRNAHSDWKVWMRMMLMVVHGAESLSDLSFLQSRCLRATLLSLQTKHQLRAIPPQTEENDRTVVSCEHELDGCRHFTPLLHHLHRNFHPIAPSLFSRPPNFIDRQHRPRIVHLHPDLSPVHSVVFVFLASSIADHSRQILSSIHLILTRPPPPSISWLSRRYHPSDSELDTLFVTPPRFIDENETFTVSLFDETDDVKLMTSLNRCLAVVKATKSAKCIDDIDTFRTRLLAGVYSSNLAVQSHCHRLFFQFGDILRIVDDPHDDRFVGLRTAIIDGSTVEKNTLLEVWGRWLEFMYQCRNGQMMSKSDFNFRAFLAADMSSHVQQRGLDVRALEGGLPAAEQSEHYRSPFATTLGSILSVFRGFDFPTVLTELIRTDLDPNPKKFSHWVNPAFFLNHTSIAPKHRPSFFPMDLMFERYLRTDPDAFLREWPDPTLCTSSKFLHNPFVGLHSLLLRCPNLHLDLRAFDQIVSMFFFETDHPAAQALIHQLFCYLPPPHLTHTLLSSPSIVTVNHSLWLAFLNVFCEYCVFSAPFGACSSLAEVFKLLSPFDLSPNQEELESLSVAGETVVSLHWLSIPAHFDSPLICHLPSLAAAQRVSLQHLSSLSGIPSLVTPLTTSAFKDQFSHLVSQDDTFLRHISIISLHVRSLAVEDLTFSTIRYFVSKYTLSILRHYVPAAVSAALKFFSRFVSISSDAVRMKLVKRGLLDHVVFTVSRSSYLDDYENGITVIGILLATIRRYEQRRRLKQVDFSRVF